MPNITPRTLPTPGDPATSGAWGATINGAIGDLNGALNAMPSPAGGAHLRRAYYALASRNSEPCDVFIAAGDSIAASYGSTTRANFLSQKLCGYLRALNPQTAAGGAGFISAVPDATFSANPVPDAPQSGGTVANYGPFNGNPTQALDSAEALLTAGVRTQTFTGTGFDFYWFYYSPTAGVATVKVDGVTYGVVTGPVTPRGGTGNGAYFTLAAGAGNLTQNAYAQNFAYLYKIRGLTAGSHTVTLTWMSGSVLLAGAFAYNGDETAGIRVTQAGWSGKGTRNYVGATYGAGTANPYPPGGAGSAGGNSAEQWLYLIQTGSYLPDIVVLDNFANDWIGSATDVCPAPENLSNLRSIIAQIKAAVVKGCVAQGLGSYIPSFVLMPPHCIGNYAIGAVTANGGTVVDIWQNYAANAYTIAATDPDGAVSVFDLGQRLQGAATNTWDNSSYQGLLYADHVHPSNAGSDWIARALATFLTAA